MSLTVFARSNVRHACCRAIRNVGTESQRRSLSTVLLRSRFTPLEPLKFRQVGDCRSFWWPGKASVPKDTITDTPSVSDTSVVPPAEPVISDAATITKGQSAIDSAPAAGTSVPPVLDASNAAAASPLDTVSALAPSADTILLPTQLGDMAALGLVHYTPAGFFPWLLEFTHVFTGLPWWGTIVVVTGIARASVFPFVVMGARTAAKMAEVQPRLKKLQAEMTTARERNNSVLLNRAILKQRSLFAEKEINPLSPLVTSLVQITVQLGFFFGLRRMCELPVEQLKTGGLGYLTDLTIADPYYILPLVNVVAMNIQLSLAARDVGGTTPSAPHVMNAFRVLSVVGLAFLAHFPAGLNLHLTASIMLICLQTLLLRLPRVRRTFKLPPLPPNAQKPPSIRDSIEYMRQAWRRQLVERSAEMEEKENLRKMMRK